jgi:predicted MPP superfamily phosphohydrolase
MQFIAPGIIFILLILAFYSIFVEPRRLVVRELDIYVRGLDARLSGVRICHLSDLHFFKHAANPALLKGIRSRASDLYVITGDFVHSHAGLSALEELLAVLKAPVFAVPGNGEYKIPVSSGELYSLLKKHNVQMLLNKSLNIAVKGAPVCVIGVDDPFTQRDNLCQAMQGAGSHGFCLLLAHSPDVIGDPCADSVDLILAGHTHGGQLRPPLWGAVWDHTRLRLGVVDGLFSPQSLSQKTGRKICKTQLFVNRGMGGRAVRARFLCPPEVVFITLRQAGV